MEDRRPILALTIGDPAGIGPEILVRALDEGSNRELLRPLVIGDAGVLRAVVDGCQLDLEVRPVDGPEALTGDPGIIEVMDLDNVGKVEFGKIDPQYGRAAVEAIETAARLAADGRVHGLVTGPINKEAIWAAGSAFPGHTEMLADLLGVGPEAVMTMFVLDKLRIFFLTRHHSLREAIDRLETGMVAASISRVDELVRELGVKTPKLALAALNPHGGEGGKLGTEEREILAPAVERARAEGIDVAGPVPADAVFYQCRMGRWDAVLSLFHDQGHVAAKTLDFFGTVACELGLPVIRTSVDHGTAFDIAGSWQADPRGQVAAMRVGAELAPKVLQARAKAG
jgi:4-hydroxythreonine-4-phosphate dehydrogenase